MNIEDNVKMFCVRKISLREWSGGLRIRTALFWTAEWTLWMENCLFKLLIHRPSNLLSKALGGF